MQNEQLGSLFYRELEKSFAREDLNPLQQLDAAYALLNLVFVEATRQERLRFNTLFARVAYASQQYHLSRSLQFFIHSFRKQAADAIFTQKFPPEKSWLPALGFKVLFECIGQFFGGKPPETLRSLAGSDWPFPLRPADIQSFKSSARVVALEHFPRDKQLLIKDEDQPDLDLRMQYDLPDYNEQFNSSIKIVSEIIGFPVNLALLDIEIDAAGTYRPRAIVIEPDYLTDVTAIAECFKSMGIFPEAHLLRKFLSFEQKTPILKGNIANFFLDELMINPDADYRATLIKLFRSYPLNLTALNNQELEQLLASSQKHFLNLKKVIRQDLPELGIAPEKCYLEPSFYNATYGIQGRLDVLYHQGRKSAIIELKSGNPFNPNTYGINNSHYIQTLLYDLMIRTVLGKDADPVNYILYSGVDDRHLRFGPVIKSQQFEALQVRNRMLGIEYQMAELGMGSDPDNTDLIRQGRQWLRQIEVLKNRNPDRFVANDIAKFTQTLSNGTETELRYFFAFTGFIAREHKLSKIGVEDLENVNGQSALWRLNYQEKEHSFEILANLSILENLAATEAATIRFAKTAATNPLANFRPGDVAILYPATGEGHSPLSNQLFKGTIIDLSAEAVTFQLRARQFNDQIFRAFQLWNLEHDIMDNTYMNMYRGLYDFVGSSGRWKQLLLGIIPPEKPATHTALSIPREMTAEQGEIYQRIIASNQYFLLWGPPGTGKTSVMLKYLVGYWYQQTSENLLLLAYTNRAVDEICAAIEAFDAALRDNYLRVGSRFSTAAEYQERLLQVQCENLTNRQEIRTLIGNCRIFVGTVASVTGKTELLDLKSFDRIIIDEASQIPEPLLAGFLPRFQHALLIGDHKQLPAVVRQEESATVVNDEALNSLGLYNLRNSLFERLYKRCQSQGWHWAFAQLSHQGRMHRQVMEFSNRMFYEGKLNILPESVAGHEAQVREKWLEIQPEQSGFLNAVAHHRMLFFPTPSDQDSPQQKVNRYEAQLAITLVQAYLDLFTATGKAFHANSIGIITPFRAQIARIRHTLEAAGLGHLPISIDTVERYQGGARDIILLSLCTNSARQLRTMVSLSEEGTDRKLNVALTRAREAIVILGNPGLLQENAVYHALLGQCHWVELPQDGPGS